MDPGAHQLIFGKWRGRTIAKVPCTYLNWLCCRENSKSRQVDLKRGGHGWLRKHHQTTIDAAQNFVKQKNFCNECMKPLVAIGYSRSNGRPHADWESRQYHKRCWKDLDSDIGSDESDDDSDRLEQPNTSQTLRLEQLLEQQLTATISGD